MNNQFPPIIFGEVLYDCFPDGSSVLGGAPFNVAWHCQAFGLKPLFISRVGDDSSGKKILSAMLDWGMNTAGLQIDSEHATGTVQVSFSDNEPSYDIVENSAWDFINSQELPKFNKESILYHGSLTLRNPVAAQSLKNIKHSISRSIFVDINLRSPWWNRTLINNIMQNIRWLKINADELNLLVTDGQNIENKARTLLSDLHLELIVVTLGVSGAIAMSQSETCLVQPENTVDVVDSVGAGDAFTSVLLLGLHKAWSLQEMLNRAQQFASKVVGLRGATTQDKNFYQSFIKNWSL
jgi:fructokinase